MTRTLVARLDSDGDVLLAGPAVRAAAATSDHVTLLVAPSGEQAARLLPGVDEVLTWACPWTGFVPPPFDGAAVLAFVERLRACRADVAVVLTSDHQSPLPLALLLRLAGVPRVVASSHDYPGSLLDVRHPPGGPHEVERNLSLVAAAGFAPSAGDTGRLALRPDLPPRPRELAGVEQYVVLHPTASVPARSLAPAHAAAVARALRADGHTVVLTGTDVDRPLADALGDEVVSLTGRTTFAELAAVLAGAACAVAVNTGPAHLAAAVGTPVVSLFAPVVPVEAWRPWGVPTVVLGDQRAPCAGTRARTCPVEGHPCLAVISPADVVSAVRQLRREVAA
ncbi:glycosyltransferase family 9 protein [Angustibacter sp. Root456]|uniref:glycosyltransferase family 9 protein n=1 Tax=Angustibacter sp. Root456 TaxID=1736539 RepID=UPI0006F79388|nr:glycosyltransferase family 9 protein [Angustibacter sp. Root456]KQX62758.1 glycosyl transferase [Angustibacter sp. Root456]